MQTRRAVWVAMVGVASWTFAAGSAEAGLLSALAKAAKVAGKAAKAGGKAGKAGKAAGAGKLAGKGALAAGAIGSAEWAAGRAGHLFSRLSDDAAGAARYVTTEVDDSYRVLSRSGDSEVVRAVDLAMQVGPIYVDLPAATEPETWSALEGKESYVLDEEGTPHRVIEQRGADGVRWMVESAGTLVDAVSFASERLQRLTVGQVRAETEALARTEDPSSTEHEEAAGSSEEELVVLGAVGVGLVALLIGVRRRRNHREQEASAP